MKKILFPTDYSKLSNNAFIHALKLAEVLSAEIITMHVYEVPVIDMSFNEVPFYQAGIYENIELTNFELYKEQTAYFRKVAHQNNLDNIKITNVMMQGDLIHHIVKFAREENIKYIVMGTSGATGLKEFFFGSTTSNVMTNTNSFVMGIPEGAFYKPIEKIGFATQFSIEELDVLRRLLKVARLLKAKVECVFVQTPNNGVSEIIINDWSQIFKDENIEFHIILSDKIEETINEFINSVNIDLFAMLNHKRGFWESFFHNSLSEKLVHHLHIPVLALHNK